jgi:hypothetical protein
MKIKGAISILGNTDEVEIEIYDPQSRCVFVSLVLTPSEFCQAAFGRLVRIPCTILVDNLEKVGKELNLDKIRFELPKDYLYANKSDLKEKAEELAVKNCPEGWTPDLYFGSQNSFFEKDGKLWAQTTIRTWVEKEKNNGFKITR